MLHTVDIVSEFTFPCNGVRCSSTLTIGRQSSFECPLSLRTAKVNQLNSGY